MKIQASKLKKNKKSSVRLNHFIDAKLKARGLSAQKVLDMALDDLFHVELEDEELGAITARIKGAYKDL